MNGAGLLKRCDLPPSRHFGKLKTVKESHDNVVKFLMLSYLVEFAESIIFTRCRATDIAVLSRKLYTAFELPGKVSLLNTQI